MRYLLISLVVLVGTLLTPSVVLAHIGDPDATWRQWNTNPLVLGGLAATGWCYASGTRALWRRAGVGRGLRRWQAAAFGGGLLALVVALVSPIDAAGGALFSAHMLQHLLLIVVAAPLLALGAPLLPLLWALPQAQRVGLGRWWKQATTLQTVARLLLLPLVATLLHTLAVWLWHTPAWYEWALRSEWAHALEHASFLFSALLFWWVLLHPARRGMGYGASLMALFLTATQGAVFGALMTFAQRPWYAAHTAGAVVWRVLHPTGQLADEAFICRQVEGAVIQQALLEDQQLAGLLMWVPPGIVYAVVAAALAAAWLRSVARQVEEREHWQQKRKVIW
jgi:putative membrane protein